VLLADDAVVREGLLQPVADQQFDAPIRLGDGVVLAALALVVHRDGLAEVLEAIGPAACTASSPTCR